MTGKQQIWILDPSNDAYRHVRDELSRSDLSLTTFASVDEMLTAARSAHSRLPRFLLVDSAFVPSLLLGQPSAAPRAALLRHAPLIIVADETAADADRQAQELGALAVVRKPFAAGELAATLLRCRDESSAEPSSASGLTFNVALLTVANGLGEPVILTPREFQILSLLHNAENHSTTRAALFANVWAEVKVCNKVLDVHVSKLRKKLQGLGVGITFLRPASYRLEFQGVGAASAGAPEMLPLSAAGAEKY